MKAVIFDLDGVIVSTDSCHYKGWKKMCDEEGIYFDEIINNRLRGVSRAESLEIILERATRKYSEDEKLEMMTRKNGYYLKFITELTPDDILPGVMRNLEDLKANGIKIAIGSSSKNTPVILKQIKLNGYFDAVSDGNNITNSKPDPEVFLKAADMLGVDYRDCLVVEDADAGITAGNSANMTTLAVNGAKGADYSVDNLAESNILDIIKGE